ncbi:MAG: glycosyltransferase family A protein [Actinomycetota bacterium]
MVLTIGEGTTDRAIASVRRQTLPPREVLVIEGVTPFHRALNLAASRVPTPFFMQVDADMALDEDCLESLRAHMRPGVGATVGPLRDPLMGNVAGIKLFSRACFDHAEVPNSISPDTDFLARIERHDWLTLHVLKQRGARSQSHTFGEHRPDFTPDYLYATYYLLGTRYRYLREIQGLMWRLERLRRTRHSLAVIGMIGMGHGLFFRREDDVPKSHAPRQGLEFLERFLRTRGEYPDAHREAGSCLALPPDDMLKRSYELGVALRRASAYPALQRCIRILGEAKSNTSWVAEVGLYHGLLSQSGPDTVPETDREIVSELLR